MATLYIVRHGNTFAKGDVVRRIGRRTDLPLSQSGIVQAESLGETFTQDGLRFAQAVVAPLKRTMQTAQLIGARMQQDLPVSPRDTLTEIDYGVDENQPEDDVVTRIGADAMQQWNDHALPPAGWQVDPAALTQAWRAFFEDLSRMQKETCILAVTSNGVARFAFDAADTYPEDAPRKLRTGAYGVVAIARCEDTMTAHIKEWDRRP